MKIVTTAAQAILNSYLPKDLQDYKRVLDKKGTGGLLQTVAVKYPGQYKDILFNLKKMGEVVGYKTGSSFSIEDFKSPVNKEQIIDEAAAKLPAKGAKYEDIINTFGKARKEIEEKTLAESLKRGNSLAHFVVSGARGSASQLASTISTSVMYSDALGRPIPVPVKHSFSEGLDPTEYWASTYGTRKGVIATKFATPEGGFFNKQVGYISGNMLITEDDCKTTNGIEAKTEDPENLGRLTAKSYLNYPANTIISNAFISDLKKANINSILIRSPISCESDNGVCKKCFGNYRNGIPPEVGENVGINSSAALTEPFTQGAMKEKHTGGVIKTRVETLSGLPLVRQLLKVPEVFKSGATVAEADGKINKIEPVERGGWNIYIGKKIHYIRPEYDILVKEGDNIEAGQPLSNGIINPADVTKFRGIGEGRKSLFDSLRQAYVDDGKKMDKIHMETLARSAVNLAQVNDNEFLDDNVPGDIGTISKLQKYYKPDYEDMDTSNANGKFLAKPYLHLTAGTQLKPSMLEALSKNGYNKISVTDQQPPFSPVMIRLDDVPSYKDNWLARLFSQQVKKKILQAVHGGESAKIHSEEFIPSYIYGKEFGKPKVGY